jgi:phosphoserine phosphatase RsbU/P
VLHRDGSHHRLDVGGSVLGVFKQQSFESDTVQLAPGDRVLLFTDGVTEAHDADGDEFGDARLLSILQECRDRDSRATLDQIFDTVGRFCRSNWHDDATLIVLTVE